MLYSDIVCPRSRQIAKLPSHTMRNQTLGSIATKAAAFERKHGTARFTAILVVARALILQKRRPAKALTAELRHDHDGLSGEQRKRHARSPTRTTRRWRCHRRRVRRPPIGPVAEETEHDEEQHDCWTSP